MIGDILLNEQELNTFLGDLPNFDKTVMLYFTSPIELENGKAICAVHQVFYNEKTDKSFDEVIDRWCEKVIKSGLGGKNDTK